MWKTVRGSFESRRAIEVGRRVAREVTAGVDVTSVHNGTRVATAGGLLNVRQGDRNGLTSAGPSNCVSANGRFVAFASSAQLVDTDRNQFPDVYVLDVQTGQVTLENVGSGSAPGNGWSGTPNISADGRYVVFESVACNLAEAPMTCGETHVFLRDREQRATRLLTVNARGEPANGASRNAAMSADGTVVVFESTATDLIDVSRVGHDSVGIYMIRLASGHRSQVDVRAGSGLQKGRACRRPSAQTAASSRLPRRRL